DGDLLPVAGANRVLYLGIAESLGITLLLQVPALVIHAARGIHGKNEVKVDLGVGRQLELGPRRGRWRLSRKRDRARARRCCRPRQPNGQQERRRQTSQKTI